MKVTFSELATRKTVEVSAYLASEWSEKVKMDFAKTLRGKINTITTFPESRTESEVFHNLRRCVVTKQPLSFTEFNPTKLKL